MQFAAMIARSGTSITTTEASSSTTKIKACSVGAIARTTWSHALTSAACRILSADEGSCSSDVGRTIHCSITCTDSAVGHRIVPGGVVWIMAARAARAGTSVAAATAEMSTPEAIVVHILAAYPRLGDTIAVAALESSGAAEAESVEKAPVRPPQPEDILEFPQRSLSVKLAFLSVELWNFNSRLLLLDQRPRVFVAMGGVVLTAGRMQGTTQWVPPPGVRVIVTWRQKRYCVFVSIAELTAVTPSIHASVAAAGTACTAGEWLIVAVFAADSTWCNADAIAAGAVCCAQRGHSIPCVRALLCQGILTLCSRGHRVVDAIVA